MALNLHSVYMSVGKLGIRCTSCSRRNVLDEKKLGGGRGDMRELRTLRFRCSHCNCAGSAKSEFELYLPHDNEHVARFLRGGCRLPAGAGFTSTF